MLVSACQVGRKSLEHIDRQFPAGRGRCEQLMALVVRTRQQSERLGPHDIRNSERYPLFFSHGQNASNPTIHTEWGVARFV